MLRHITCIVAAIEFGIWIKTVGSASLCRKSADAAVVSVYIKLSNLHLYNHLPNIHRAIPLPILLPHRWKSRVRE